jgi:hypothetical protein
MGDDSIPNALPNLCTNFITQQCALLRTLGNSQELLPTSQYITHNKYFTFAINNF